MKKLDINEQALMEFKDIGFNCNTIEELEEALSDEFASLYNGGEMDAQVAYSEMNYKYQDLLEKYFVYSLSKEDETWSIGIGERFKEKDLQKYIGTVNSYYENNVNGKSIEGLNDLLSFLDYQVYKDMSNVGCDVFNALRMILEELNLEECFKVVGADGEPSIISVQRLIGKFSSSL